MHNGFCHVLQLLTLMYVHELMYLIRFFLFTYLIEKEGER